LRGSYENDEAAVEDEGDEDGVEKDEDGYGDGDVDTTVAPSFSNKDGNVIAAVCRP
jgi:hypothetical protein